MDGNGLPLGLIKQAYLKLEAFAGDIYEILEEEDLTEDQRNTFQTMKEMSTVLMAHLINIIKEECGEEEFLAEEVPMDEIEGWPGDDLDIMDQEIE